MRDPRIRVDRDGSEVKIVELYRLLGAEVRDVNPPSREGVGLLSIPIQRTGLAYDPVGEKVPVGSGASRLRPAIREQLDRVVLPVTAQADEAAPPPQQIL